MLSRTAYPGWSFQLQCDAYPTLVPPTSPSSGGGKGDTISKKHSEHKHVVEKKRQRKSVTKQTLPKKGSERGKQSCARVYV